LPVIFFEFFNLALTELHSSRHTEIVFITVSNSKNFLSFTIIHKTCLGGSGDRDTVRTDRDGLSEEPGFNPRVSR